MQIIAMLLTAIMAFFSWIASPFLPDRPERTDFIVDGKYWGFSTSEKTMSNFLRLTEAEDAETIDESGIFHKRLTIKSDKDFLDGGGLVTLTTSLPATVTCDSKYIEVTQKDAYTWEAVLPNQLSVFAFTATTEDESVTCKVTIHSKESDTE